VNPIAAIAGAKLRMARHAIASVRTESKLKVSVISVSVAALWVGAFFLFKSGFDFLVRFGVDVGGVSRGIGSIILVRMLSVLMLAVFFMLIFSNVLVSFSTLYRSREVNYLIQNPLTFRTFFVVRFFEIVAFSSWALAYLGSPLFLAYGLSTHAPLAFYAATLAFFIPFITLPAALGSMITLALARIFPRLKMRMIILLGILAVGLLFVYWRDYLSATRISEDTILPALLDMTAQTQSPLLPSYWASRGILAAAGRDYGEAGFNLLLLTANALMALWLAAEVAQRIFYPGWSSLVGRDKIRVKLPGRGILGRLDKVLRALPNPTRVLVIKDIKLFWRDPTQWSQFVIFFGIMAVYIANLRNTTGRYPQDFWRSWIACLNIGACTLILATLTSRFVFPLVSLEGRRFWILGLAPLSFRRLVWQKFWLSVATTCFFTVGLAALSGYMLELEPIYFALSVYSVLITNFGLAGLAVGLGTLYPNFQEDNPARIVSGMGGTLNFLLSVAYITLVVGAQTVILQWRVLQLYTRPGMFYVALGIVIVFVTGLSAFSALAPMRLGLRNLNRMEF
jgi:ABC-2 type transport system permease protein